MARKKSTTPAAPAPAIEPKKGAEGWGDVRPRDVVSHYYRDGSSLCHQVGLYAGDLQADQEDRDHGDDCQRCVHRLGQIGVPA